MLRAPGVVLINPKFPHNVGGTIRACSCFGVESLVWTGLRVDASKYRRLPREERMKGYKSVLFSNNQRPFYLFEEFRPVCIEVFEQSEPLTTFEHPENAVYVFGPEDGGVPQVIRRLCHRFVHIPVHFCLNLSAAVNVVLAHRLMSRQLSGKHAMLPLSQMLHEVRGGFSRRRWTQSVGMESKPSFAGGEEKRYFAPNDKAGMRSLPGCKSSGTGA